MNAETLEQAKTNGKMFDIDAKILLNLKPGQCFIKTEDGQRELQVVPSWDRTR
jgi:hypothetical protein